MSDREQLAEAHSFYLRMANSDDVDAFLMLGYAARLAATARLILSGDVRGVLDLMGVEAHQIEVVDSGPREDGYGGWVQEEPHIVSSVIEPARCHLKRGTWIVVRVEGSDHE